MQDKILELLKNEDRPLEPIEICDKLGLKSVEDLKEVIKLLKKMSENLKVFETKKGKYMLYKNSHLQPGIFMGTKRGFGFVDIEGDIDVFIAPTNLNGAIHGDTVLVEITAKQGVKWEGKIEKIVKREMNQTVGEFFYRAGKAYVDIDHEKVNILVEVDKSLTLGAMNGHKVIVKLGDQINKNLYNGQIIKVLGHKNDPGVDILSIVYKHNIETEFNNDVMKEIETIPMEVTPKEYANRRDLREEVIFTIDGDDTKDIDDAISLKKLDNGNFELGVHIADVSYYVTPNSELDKTAYNRGTSVYLADRVIPMLPHKLSNGICSLNPEVDRLAISCVMEIDNSGKILSEEIFESVIKSRKQMTYKNVNKVLDGETAPEGYEEYATKLLEMQELATILRKHKEKRGYIDFNIEENKIIVNESGEAIDVVLRNRGKGEKLIEDFMIAANEAVATHVFFMELPFVYRVHAEPNEERIKNFLSFVSKLGIKIVGKVDDITPLAMQHLLNQLNDKKEFYILSNQLLRSMTKAVYSPDNIGHFGLASKIYTHFTSPIRRYPDKTVHHLLREYLFKGNMDQETRNYYERMLPELTEHSSFKERTSVECEREVNDMKEAEYMQKHIGEIFPGMVSSVTSFGMFVQLPNLIEGLVSMEDMGEGTFTYKEEDFAIYGQNSKTMYRLGDNVEVIVKSTLKDEGKIDFVVLTEQMKKELEANKDETDDLIKKYIMKKNKDFRSVKK